MQDLLEQMLSAGSTFRAGQREAIDALVRDRKRVLVVQQTGWGKSLVYFLATRLLRNAGSGPTLLISPLIALMRNQIEWTERVGIRAAIINSTNRDEWDTVEAALASDAVDALLISPERLSNERFLTETLPRIKKGIGLLAIDEAHCISDWGHDFRPDYRRIARIVQRLPPNVPVLATTATANDRVVADIVHQLGSELLVMRGPLARDSLRLQVIVLLDQAERLAWLAEHVPTLSGSGIIYCLTVADCLRVSGWLIKRGVNAPAYYGDLEDEARTRLEQQLLHNEVKALVATVALGMGFDKPDLGFVVHFQRPGSVVAYYQQIGRAGRALDTADVILLSGREDDEVQSYFIDTAFPSEEATREVLTVLSNHDQLSRGEILAETNLSQSVVEKVLKLAEIDGTVGREKQTYFRTIVPWAPNTLKVEIVTAQRWHEVKRMQAFVKHDGCLMEFMARELDDPTAHACGRCAQCAGEFVDKDVQPALVQEAVAYLHGNYQRIPPRLQWPSGGVNGLVGRIPREVRLEEGRALCLYGDAGWGTLIKKNKYEGSKFDDLLVSAMATMIHDEWRPAPSPAWVTAVPSLRRPTLVLDFAVRLANLLGLPFVEVLAKTVDTPPQKGMMNSFHQARSALESFSVVGSCPSGAVLLIDDIVDSRWTLTICGIRLREAGSGPVFPCTLAVATGGN